MKAGRKGISLLLTAALVLAVAVQTPVCAKAKGSAKKTKYYTISKEAGTYKTAIKVKIKVKKGFRVYYKTSGKFKKTKVIQGGKSKTIQIKKTTVLSLCAVKKSRKVTNKKLNRGFKKNKKAYYAKYKYVISKSGASQGTETAAGSTVTASGEGTESAAQGSSSSESTQTTASPVPTASAGTTQTANPIVTKAPAVIDETTASVTLSSAGIASTANLETSDITYAADGNKHTLTINHAGTYVLTGGTVSEPVTNTQIAVAEDVSGEVSLVWDNLVINNEALGTSDGEDAPVFKVEGSTPDIQITLKGSNVLTGNGAYQEEPAAALICADDSETTLTFSAYDENASLTLTDAIEADTDFGDNDPTDGIYCKGTLVLDAGTYSITVNGDCLKGTGKKGSGGIVVNGGAYHLCSNQSNALKSKNGTITINGGTISSVYTAEDGINAKNYGVVVTGGSIDIDNCYGDGIQGETVTISGDSTEITIATYYENAGINYYNSSLGTGNYNTLTESDSTKTEVVNVDTGSHKGIKGGTKAHTYSYESVSDGSDYEAGTTYSTDASGGIVISGGTITIDTTHTGIKYNGSGNTGGSNRTSSTSGNLSAASDGKYIIGAPDDGIHSNNTCVIEGGTLSIQSADDGITGPAGVQIAEDADITISMCYEGIEGGEIVIGSSETTAAEPKVRIYSNDDGVNAASKSSVHYVYADESEEAYTKTETASSDNVLKVYSGYLNVMIGDDMTHSFSLSNADGTTTTGSYTSDGDGIDCNGSFYAYGGTIIINGGTSDGNSAVDTDSTYYIGSGVTLLAMGSSGMAESPTEKKQAVITYGGSSSGGFNGMMGGPGQSGNRGGSQALSEGTAFAFMNGENVLLAVLPAKAYTYILYSSPEIVSGTSYTLYSGGTVSGSLIQADAAYDTRYTGYDTTGASTAASVTAQ